jgi:predicted RNA polymerase sigma factor
MFKSPQAGLELLAEIEGDPHLASGHRLPAVRAHLLEQLGESNRAIEAYQTAARLTTSRPERDDLLRKATALADRTPPRSPR